MRMHKCLLSALLMLVLVLSFSAASAITDGKIVGEIEKIETYGKTLHIVGWVYDKETSSKSLTIDIDSLARYSANIYRSDVNQKYGISGNHGFDIEHPWTTDGVRVMIHALYGAGSGAMTLFDNISDFPYTYTVTYNANGGTGAPKADVKHSSIALRLSTTKPTRTGYTFKGWATSATGAVAYAAGASYTSNSARTLYAVWQKNTYTLSYDANGGTGAPASQSGQYNTSVTLSQTVPQYEGHDFMGWATSATGSASYQPGSALTLTGNQTLYAVWAKKNYIVTFDANGGANAPAAQTKVHGEDLTLTGEIPTRAEYVFLGWAADPAAQYPACQPGDVYAANAPITLYALWEPARIPGDINGDKAVTDADVSLLLSYLAGNDVSIAEKNASVNGDSLIDGRDALRLMQYVAGFAVVLE